eukprot:5808528-Pyramimonas_sp.AAC.1
MAIDGIGLGRRPATAAATSRMDAVLAGSWPHAHAHVPRADFAQEQAANEVGPRDRVTRHLAN